jgi:hypothetical protein
MNRQELLEALTDDAVFKKYRSILEIVQSSIDPTKTQEEAVALHKARPARELWKQKKLDPNALNNAIIKDLSTRARLVELQTQLLQQADLLKTTMSGLKDHILSKYSSTIKSLCNNAEERNALMRRIMSKGVKQADSIEIAITVIGKIIEDIDKSGFSLRNATELIKVILERPGQVV